MSWASLGSVSYLSASSAGANGLPYTPNETLERLKDGLVSMAKICIYRGLKPSNPLFYHDFLLIDVNSIFLEDVKKKGVGFIKAEKIVISGYGKVIVAPLSAFDDGDLVTKHELDIMKGCGRILMSDLLQILESPTSDYNLFHDNCWKYADDVFRELIQKLSELPDTTTRMKSSLIQYGAQLPRLQLPSDVYNLDTYTSCRIAEPIMKAVSFLLPEKNLAAAGLGKDLKLCDVDDKKWETFVLSLVGKIVPELLFSFDAYRIGAASASAPKVGAAASSGTAVLSLSPAVSTTVAVVLGTCASAIVAERVYRLSSAVIGGVNLGPPVRKRKEGSNAVNHHAEGQQMPLLQNMAPVED